MTQVSSESLRTLRAEVAARLVQRAADGDAPLAELRELEQRLNLIDAALAASKSRRGPWSPLWPLLVVAALVSLAASVPVRSVPFSIEADARALSLRLDAAGELGPQAIDGGLRVEGFTRVETPDVELAATVAATRPDRLALSAPTLNLRRVAWPAGSQLVVEGGETLHLSLHAPTAPVVVAIEFAGDSRWQLGDEAHLNRRHEQLEWMQLVAGDAATPARRPPPVDVWLGRDASRSVTFAGLRPAALQFVERRSASEGVLASSLEQARIVLPATGGEVKLASGDRLELAGIEVERFELVAGATLKIKLSGSARGLATRSGDFERSLKPSLLEYAARHHTLGLAWSAAALLWGIVGWMRRQFGAA